MGSGERSRQVPHRIPTAVASAALLAGTALLARHRPVPSWELDITTWLNGAPDPVGWVLYPVIQVGSLVGPTVAAVLIALWGRDRVHALSTAVAGLVAWFGAKAIKSIVERGRPGAYLPGIDIREGSASGYGFISGHAAVAAMTAVCLVVIVPPSRRWVLVVLAATVGIGRIVYGVHLPADVIGGWAFGYLTGLLALVVSDEIDHLRRRSAMS